jgi:hypothetical protein
MSRSLPAGFIAPCLPIKTTKLPYGGEWLHEIKYDGFRMLVRRDATRLSVAAGAGAAAGDFTPSSWASIPLRVASSLSVFVHATSSNRRAGLSLPITRIQSSPGAAHRAQSPRDASKRPPGTRSENCASTGSGPDPIAMCYPGPGQRHMRGRPRQPSIQNTSGLPQGLAGSPASGWRYGRLSARASRRR